MQCEPTKTPEQIDLAALREKYRHERDRRLRPDGDRQYIEVVDDYAGYHEIDPYSPPIVRDAISEELEVAIIGGGFAGLLAGARLRDAGIDDFRIVEMGGDFGGTWYWNRYPAVQCDNESYCYMPLLEELNYVPEERYSHGPEILEHCRRIGRHFRLYDSALFGTIVRSLRWDESIERWRIATDRGDDIRARFLILASGPYSRARLPGIPGINSFKGRSFHTSRWDYDYTGGDTTGGFDKLADKRVAIIGTGATAIQAIPHLARGAKHLYVFQRTPSTVDDRGNRKTDPEWAASLKPGWQAERRRNYNTAVYERFGPGMADLLCDGWTEINRNLAARLDAMGWPELTAEEFGALREAEDFRAMSRLRQRVEDCVQDRATAETLKPWYHFMCKRPTFNDDYLPTFNRPNVTLVDVSASLGVDRITETGLVANGTDYQVDCIIYASGFEINAEIKRRIGIATIEGRDGRSLYDYWAAGYRTLHGMTVNGFPNMFLVGFYQGGLSINLTDAYDQQARHCAHIIRAVQARGATTVEPSAQAEDGWVTTMRETAVSNVAFLTSCTPGYFNNEGAVGRSRMGEVYGPGFYAFDALLQDWREEGELRGLVIA